MKSKFSVDRIRTHGVMYGKPQAWFAQLTPAQREIIQTKQINGDYTTTEWLELFKNIETYDISASVKHAGFGGNVLRITIPLAILNFILFMTFTEREIVLVTVLLFLGLIITWLMAYKYSVKLHKTLLPDYFRTVLIPLVTALHEETDESTPLHITMDLRHQMDSKAHLIEENLHKRVYDWHVLQVNTELHQGVRMRLNVRIHNHLRLRKNKSKRRVFIDLTMEYSKKKHQLIRPALVDQQRFKVKHTEKPKKHLLRLRRQFKFKNKFFNFYQYVDIPFSELVFMIRSGCQVALREQQT